MRRWYEIFVMMLVSPWGVAAFLFGLTLSLDNWRLARNMGMASLAVLYFPAYLITSGNWRIFAPALALAGVLMLVAVGHDVWKVLWRRRYMRKIIAQKNARMRM